MSSMRFIDKIRFWVFFQLSILIFELKKAPFRILWEWIICVFFALFFEL